MENNYRSIIKNIIHAKVKDSSNKSLTTNDLYNLLPSISEQIRSVAKIYGIQDIDSVTLQDYYESSLREYLSVNPIEIDPANSLVKEGFRTWLTAEKIKLIKWNYSQRYFNYLSKSSRSANVIQELEETSLDILKKMGDPKSGKGFYIKGLVVGSVQSGKTTNFNAVINRAIDAGYGLIIVLSGIMEDLRSQTQKRIENDVIGTGIVDTARDKKDKKGVGNERQFGIQGSSDKDYVEQVLCITSYKSDFNKPLADAEFSLNHINILVCKKNVSILKNLLIWLHDYLEESKEKHNIPLLIIDDEADNASLNNYGHKGRDYASKINGHIRALLDLFNKRTYLGYTATPFANVLQDRNAVPEKDWLIEYKLKGQKEQKSFAQVSNIFPDDFIVLLNPPSNYIGAKQIFETIEPINNEAEEKIPLVEIVDDHLQNFPTRVFDNQDGETVGVLNIRNKEEWNNLFGYNSYLFFQDYDAYRTYTRGALKTDLFPVQLPESLKESVICFILAIAVRDNRKKRMVNSALFNPHNTMLVHVSRYTLWQNRTKELLADFVKKLEADIACDNPESDMSIYKVFEKIWYKHYAEIIESINRYLPLEYRDEFLYPVTFGAIKQFLPDAIQSIQVKAINSSPNGDILEYNDKYPQKIIAVGGNRLSRGFTLEGLTINYFIRTTNYSDTLLQMGRWFGYRPGYIDCCKLFTTQDAFEKFNYTTRAIEELEMEFRKMEAKNKSPKNFILRVRKHPDTLKVTRPSILKNTVEVKWSYQDQLEQTTKFTLEKEKMLKVWDNFINNIAKKPFIMNKNKGFLMNETNTDGIIELLEQENNFDEDTRKSMIMFLELCKKNKKLKNWTIAIKITGDANAQNAKGILSATESNLQCDINLSIRSGPKPDSVTRSLFVNNKTFIASGKSANIISSGNDFSILLDPLKIQEAKEEFWEEKKKNILRKYKDMSEEEALNKAKAQSIPERVFREKMSDQQGLLIIYLFDSTYVFRQEKGNKDEELSKMVSENGYDLNIPLIGYAIGFPPIGPDPGGVYIRGDYDLNIDEENDFEEEDDLLNDLED